MEKHHNQHQDHYDEPFFASVMRSLGCIFGYCGLACCCGMCCYPYQTVDKGQRGLITEFGRLIRNVGDGLHYVNPITEKIVKVSEKIQMIDLDKQNVMTADKLTVVIDSIVFFQVINAEDSCFKIQNLARSVMELSHTTMRNVVGVSDLETCLSKREEIALQVKDIVEEAVSDWGIKIISIQIKDIKIPQDIATALSSAVTAERRAQAKLITAEADIQIAKTMREAADILDTPAAMQVRGLEVIKQLATSSNTKVILLPSDLSLSSTSYTQNVKQSHNFIGEDLLGSMQNPIVTNMVAKEL